MLSSRSARALRGLAVAAATVLVSAAAGCDAGSNAPTQQWHQSTPGASRDLGKIAIRNVFILGPDPASTLPVGASAGLFLALVNDGSSADRLVSISARRDAASVTMPTGGIAVTANGRVLLQGPAPEIVLHHLTRSLRGGQYIPVTLNFQNAGSTTLPVPVMPRAAYFATYHPPASPAPSPSPTATGTHTGGATSSPTPAPTASPTG